MKKLSLIIALSLASIASYAQMYQVYGHIQDGSSQPVVGQVVTASNWSNWTLTATTDANGDYSIDIPNSTPVGSFIDVSLFVTSCNQNYYDSVYWQIQQDFQSDFTVCNTPPPPPPSYYVTGVVTANGNGIDAGMVYLINEQYDVNTQTTTLTAIDSAYTDTMQGYYMMDVPATITGTLKVKAAMIPGSPGYANYLPTYFTSSLTWNGTGVSTIPAGANSTANIALIAGVNPGGPGFVGGDVLQGANKSTAPGDPLEGRIMILTNAANTAVAYTYTDVDGHFSFTGLAYGTYKLFGDVWGKANPAIQFTLTASNPGMTTIEFQENSDSFDGSLWPASVATSPELAAVAVYPNPVADVVNVKGLNKIEGAKTITITSINGAVSFSKTYQQNETVSIPVTGLSSGFYMLQINTTKGNSIYKIVK
jgi:hypothetical protein